MSVILLIVSLILLLLASINWPASPVNMTALGLFFYVLAQVVR